jgi:hypothetical protein
MQHSGIRLLSPVPSHSGTGLGLLILIPNCSRHQNFNSFRTDRNSYSPAFPHLKTLSEGEERYTLHALLRAMKMDTPSTSTLHDDGVGWIHPSGHTAGGTYELLAVKRDTPCTSTLLGLLIDTPCTPHCRQWKGDSLHVYTL